MESRKYIVLIDGVPELDGRQPQSYNGMNIIRNKYHKVGQSVIQNDTALFLPKARFDFGRATRSTQV